MAGVVVVGAGPAGAALAFLLARRGIDVTLLERQTDFEREFRGEVLMPSAFDALKQMGLASETAKLPQVTLAKFEGYLLGKRFFHTEFDATALAGELPRWVSQPALLEMLTDQASRFPSFRLERGATVRDLLRDGDRVVGVRAQTQEGERELRADLVVGADGRASVTRRRSGVAVRRDRVELDVVWCKLPVPEEIARDPQLRFYLGHGHLLIAAPTPDSSLQLGWIIRKGKFGDLRRRGVPEWLEELANHVDPALSKYLRAHKHESIRPFLLDAVSDRVEHWSQPGLLLIGDAAHTMSPVGAQGINIAIRDALIAANELVPALSDGTSPEAIDAASARVEAERLPEVREIKRLQAIPPYVVLNDAWWARLALRFLAPLLFGRGGSSGVFRRLALGTTDVTLRV
jgi:2-polyprenyl-6-methoxyphenol hydroxylase-like FAD-dependent oxidoreductase